jgi:iron complex outermembrane receptor protein
MYRVPTTCLWLVVGLAIQPTLASAMETIEVTAPIEKQQGHAVAAELQQTAGGTNLITPQQEARLSTLSDALNYQPGLVLQDFFGGIDQPRLNIRGSGIQSNPVNRGVLLLQDGLPLNEADGSFVIGTLEPRDSALIAIRRGANAREAGATTLGGSLNFIPQYGGSEQHRIRFEAGSYERYGGQAILNHKLTNGDFHLSASADSYGGFRHHSEGKRQALHSNVGLQLSDELYSRFYLSYTDLAFDIPFVVPKDRITSDPKGVMGDGNTPLDNLLNVYKRDPYRETEQLRLANKTQWQTGADRLHTLGIYAQQTDDIFTDPLSHADTQSDTLGLLWEYDFKLGATELQLAASLDYSDMQRNYHANNPANGSKLQQFGDLDMEAANNNLSLLIHHPFNKRLSLDSQLRWNRACRDVLNRLNNDELDQCWNEGNISIGLNFRATENQRWFANLSTSSEAPTFWEITAVTVAPNNPAMAVLALTDLELQQAVTLEVGGQGYINDYLNWDLAIYRSDLENELISSADMVGGRGLTRNYSDDTIHQGIELGLLGGDQLHYRMAWNYSDFRFDGGIYDSNRIAGIPEHLITAELGYRWHSLDISANLRWLPSDTQVDHANSLEQDSYALWGLELDYAAAAEWRAFVRVDNLLDEEYASAFVIRNQSGANQPSFLPGNGRSISAGVQFLF